MILACNVSLNKQGRKNWSDVTKVQIEPSKF